MPEPNYATEKERAERFEGLRREIQKGLDSSERGDVLRFSSREELMAHIKAEGRKILEQRKSPEYRLSDTNL